jgi:hypothetical protein
MSSKLNKFMKLTGKMKKIDGLVSQLEEEVQKICTDSSCKINLAKQSEKKSKRKNSNVLTNS